MCTWGTEKTIQITQTITVDACIADEIVALNAAGVHTLNACCSHGRGKSVALIKPSSADRARELGYSPVRVGEGALDRWEIVIGEGRMREDWATCVTIPRSRLRALFHESRHRYDEDMVNRVSEEYGRGLDDGVKLERNAIVNFYASRAAPVAVADMLSNIQRGQHGDSKREWLAMAHGDACMCDDCKLRGLELWSDAREEEDRKARPEEIDREFLRASPEDVETLKRQVVELQGKLPDARAVGPDGTVFRARLFDMDKG